SNQCRYFIPTDLASSSDNYIRAGPGKCERYSAAAPTDATAGTRNEGSSSLRLDRRRFHGTIKLPPSMLSVVPVTALAASLQRKPIRSAASPPISGTRPRGADGRPNSGT